MAMAMCSGRRRFAGLLLAGLLVLGPQTAAHGQPADAATVYWDSIQGSNDPVLFKGFVEKFPDHPFGQLADVRYKELTGRSLASTRSTEAAPLPPIRNDLEKSRADWLELPSLEELKARFAHKTKDKANARSAPQAKAQILKSLAPGTAVEVMAKEGAWYKVKIDNGQTAFVHESSIAGTSIDWSWLDGVTNPPIAAIEEIKAETAPECRTRPTRGCLRALLEKSLASIKDKDERLSALSEISAAFFLMGDATTGWSYFDQARENALSRDKSEYDDANNNRVSALVTIAREFSGEDLNRQAMLVFAEAFALIPSIKAVQDYYSDQEEQADAYDTLGSALLHSGATGRGRQVLDVAAAAAANLPAAGSDSAAEKREDATSSIASTYVYSGQVTEGLRFLALTMNHIKDISYLSEYGGESISRPISLRYAVSRLAALGFIEKAAALANMIPAGEYRAEALAETVAIARNVDPDFAATLAPKAAEEAGAAKSGAAFAHLLSAGFVDIAERHLSLSSLEESERSRVGEAYAELGNTAKATDIALSISDKDYRKWVYDDIVTQIAKTEGLAAARRLAETAPGVDNKELIEEVKDAEFDMYREQIEEHLKASRTGEAIEIASKALTRSKQDGGGFLSTLIAHFVKNKDLDNAISVLRLAEQAEPDDQVSVYTQALRLVK